MTTEFKVNIDVKDDQQKQEVQEALEFLATKFKAEGITTLRSVYEKKASVRFAVNSYLGIK